MSWKTFSLRKKSAPVSPEIVRNGNKSRSLKRGDETRIMLMNMVKEGKLSVDDAMKKAYGMGVASVPYEEMGDKEEMTHRKDSSGEVFNFGVFRYCKSNKVLKCVLQVDCPERLMALIHRGEKQKVYSFSSILSVEGSDDSTRFFLKFDDATEVELDADSFEDKNIIMRLLSIIINESRHGVIIDKKNLTSRQKSVIKEGLIEKRGHSAAFLVWAKRFLRISPGEIMYFKNGEEENEGNALSIITLSPNSTLIRKIDLNGFLLITNKKEYAFRVPGKDSPDSEKDRDDWILAIQEASRQAQHMFKSQLEAQSPDAVANQQEVYLKHVIKTLQEELEQLGVILNIIDAPIRASAQVKKVREVVQSLNEQVHTGILSWTLRSSARPKMSSSPLTSPSSSPAISPVGNLGCYINSVASDHVRGQSARGVYNGSGERYANLPAAGSVFEPATMNHTPFRIEAGKPCVEDHLLDPSFAYVSEDRLDDSVESESDEPPPLPPKYVESRVAFDSPPSGNVYGDQRTSHEKGHIDSHAMLTKKEIVCAKIPEANENSKPENVCLGFVPECAANSSLPSGSPLPPPPPPPPPLPHMGSSSSPGAEASLALSRLPRKLDVKPTKKLKPLFWNKIPDLLVRDSIWMHAADRTDAFPLKKLEDIFGAGPEEVAPIKNAEVAAQPARKTLLDPKKAQNLGIFMSGFKLSAEEIEEKLSIFDEKNGLEVDHVMALKRFQPTTEEVEMYKSFQGDRTQLLPLDLFMMKLCEIPNLSSRLEILLTILELPSQYKEVSRATDELLSACRSLRENRDFPRLLEYILAVGNYINGGTSRGCAYGFKLNALCKLVEVRSADKKFTLLQYIVNELLDKDRQAVHCFEEMSAFLGPMEASFKGLVGEAEVMRKDLAKLRKTVEHFSETRDGALACFSNAVVAFVRDYEIKIRDLDLRCQALTELSLSLKQQYGESSSSDFQEFLGHVSVFMKQLQRAVESSEDQLKRLSRGKQPSLQTEQKSKASVIVDEQVPAAEENQQAFPSGYAPISSSIQNSMITRKSSTDRPVDGNFSTFVGKASVYETKHATIVERRSTYSPGDNGRSFGLVPTGVDDDDEDDDDMSFPTKRGYLDKLSGGTRRPSKWDRRYFELTPAGYLNYAKKLDGKLSGSIYLRGLPLEFDPDDSRILVLRQHDRVWRLRAVNELEALDWFNVLAYYVNREELAV